MKLSDELLVSELKGIVSDLDMSKSEYSQKHDVPAEDAVSIRDEIVKKHLELLVRILESGSFKADEVEAL